MDADVILQVKVWLIGISPMVWRRVLVAASFTLRELHGVIQVAMAGRAWAWHSLPELSPWFCKACQPS